MVMHFIVKFFIVFISSLLLLSVLSVLKPVCDCVFPAGRGDKIKVQRHAYEFNSNLTLLPASVG